MSNVVRKLVRQLTGKTIEELEAQPLPEKKPPRKWWEFPVRLVRTSRGGPNMPKYQPCPECRQGSKRHYKTHGGAYYLCGKHGEFFVKAAKI